MVRQFSVIWCGKSVKFDRVGRAFVELNIGSTHGVPSESDVATVSLSSSTYAIEYGDLYGGWVRVHHHTNVCKIERLCGAMPSLSLDVSPLNLVSHLILMPSLPAASMDIRLLLLNKSPLKKKKAKPWKSIFQICRGYELQQRPFGQFDKMAGGRQN